jgi:hypothetical protein
VGSTPTLTANVLQGLPPEPADGEKLDFSQATVKVVFSLTSAGCTNSNCPSNTVWTSGQITVANGPNWANDGIGTATVTGPSTLTEGAYIVRITAVSNPYLTPLGATSGLAVAPTTGTYMYGGGTIPNDSGPDAGQLQAGSFAFSVRSGKNGPAGMVFYTYRTRVDTSSQTSLVPCTILGATCRDVDFLVRSAPVQNFSPGQATNYPFSAFNTGATDVQAIDAFTGALVAGSAFTKTGVPYRLDALDVTSGGTTDTFGLTVYNSGGTTVYHQAFIPASGALPQNGISSPTNQTLLSAGNLTVKPK